MTYRLTFGILALVLGLAVACGTIDVSGGATPPTEDAGDGVVSPPADSGTQPLADSSSTPPPDTGVPPATDGGAGGDATVPAPDAQVPSIPGPDASVSAFNQTLICFGNGGTGPCSRTVDAPVTFPATGTYTKILMHVTLDCPSNGCDHWDRVGSIDLVTPAGDAGTVTLTELGRFVTPFNIVAGTNAPPAWDIDVTELRPLLAGTVTLRAFIDTWAPQGDPGNNGGGWLLGATFEMTGGTPAKEPIAVVPIWVWKTTGKEPTEVVYGDPGQPISGSVPPQTITLPAGATSFGVRSTITGHGQANLDNCAEFCPEQHTWKVGSTTNDKTMWRTDCQNFPSSGTFQFPRAGWCPGADVLPWDFDVTSQVGSGGTVSIAYDVASYTNTCNQGAGVCTGCPAGGDCSYNGGGHTQPFYYVQSLLIGFR